VDDGTTRARRGRREVDVEGPRRAIAPGKQTLGELGELGGPGDGASGGSLEQAAASYHGDRMEAWDPTLLAGVFGFDGADASAAEPAAAPAPGAGSDGELDAAGERGAEPEGDDGAAGDHDGAASGAVVEGASAASQRGGPPGLRRRRRPVFRKALTWMTASSGDGAASEEAAAPSAADVAERATEGRGGSLPHLDTIAASFGHHDVSGVRAHTGGAAAEGAQALGASAFAVGDAVGFASAPDLHTAAHEAAHTVQQRSGVACKAEVSVPGDAYEQHADAVADAVVAGRSAEALLDGGPGTGARGGSGATAVVQRKPLGGALVTEEQAKAAAAVARDHFPGAIKLSLLGDPFEVRLDKQSGKLALHVTYLGPYAVETTAPNSFDATTSRTLVFFPDRRAVAGGSASEERPIDARVMARTDDGVAYDLYGDGSSVLELRDRFNEAAGRFDRRTHQLGGRLDGRPTMPGFLAVALPQGDSKTTDPQERVVSARFEVNGEAFTLRARRHGDSDQVVLSIVSKVGERQVLVTVPAAEPSGPAAAKAGKKPGGDGEEVARAALQLKIVHHDGRAMSIDLDGDGRPDAAFIHTVHAPSARGHFEPLMFGSDDLRVDPDAGKVFTIHTFTAYDRDAVSVGAIVHKMEGWPAQPIPLDQDASKNPPPQGHAVPDERGPQQGDLPGETSRAISHTAKDWELRIDGDGDRAKELLLRFVPGAATADHQTYSLRVVQLSSRQAAVQSFALSRAQADQFDAAGPQLVEATDGYGPAVIQLGPTPSAAPLLSFVQVPFADPVRTTYRATVAGGQPMDFSLPKETATGTWMTDIEAPPNRAKKVSTIESVEVQISEYRDRFRLTAEKVDSGEVLLGVSAMDVTGPVAGFSTRLLGIYEPRIDPHADLPTQLSFYARPNWGFANLHLTSAIDPPKDPTGRVIEAPPSVHRDHRLTLHGEAVVGEPRHTFRVRDGRFVAGWEKSADNRNAAGAAEATDILGEQSKHVQVGEFRVQLDAALDAEVEKAVARGWVDGLTAEAWSSLKQDMIFVQAQGPGGHVDPVRARRAAEAVGMVSEWLATATNGEDVRTLRGNMRRPAPGSSGGETFTGIAYNEYTGDFWNMKDSVLLDVRAGGFGPRTAQALENGKYDEALQAYQRLRTGIGKWLGKRFERDPKFGKDSPEAARMAHIAALGGSLGEIEGVAKKMQELDSAIDAEVQLASERGLLPKRTLGSWQQLKEDMVLIGGQTASGKADAGLVARASEDAKQVDWWLELETEPVIHTTAFGHINPFTGQIDPAPGHPWVKQATSFGRALREQLAAGEYGAAVESYRQLRTGVVKWIAALTEHKFGDDSAEAKQLAGLQAARNTKRDVTRVAATFIADESYEQMPDAGTYKQKDFGKYRQLALQLFVWADDGKWHIRDLSNPKNVWEGSVEFHGEEQPPPELFKELNHSEHLVEGDIYYHLPDGHSGKLRCEAKKEWYKWVQEVATILAVAGLVLATLGAATPLAVGIYATTAITTSMVLGTIADIGQLKDGFHHGFADEHLIMLNLIDLVSNLASLGAMGAGKLTMGAAKAAMAAEAGVGTAWTGGLARASQLGSLSYRSLVGIQVLSDGLSLLIMTQELQVQLDEIDKTVKDPNDRLMAKAKLVARFAVLGGLVMLSLKGELPDLRSGTPHIVLDKVNGVTVARVGDVNIGKQRIALPEHDANLHATARWQTQDLEAEARQSGKPDTKKRAGELLGDQEFQRWYAQWMQQPEKLQPGTKTVRAPEGAPPEVIKRLQGVADRGDLALHEQAFHRADDVAELREAAGTLDIDPHADTWPATRKQLIDKLGAKAGGPRRAEQVIGRYEAARLGADGDFGRYASQRAEINKVVPDSELDRIKALYPEHDVYVTGKPVGNQVEVAVVVPNGTEPALMSAIEQRAQGHVVHREPSHGGADAGHEPPMHVRARVMTEDQFFGMATAQVKGKGAPAYHRIGDDLGKSLGLGSIEIRPQGNGRYALDLDKLKTAHGGWKARSDEKVSKLKYDPDTHAMYFEIHGAGSRVRVEAPMPARITTAADLKLENRVVGTRIFSNVGQAEDLLRRISSGELDVIHGELGVALPKGFTTANGLEFGLGQLPDGRFVVIRGELGAVDWSKLPGIEARGHTHPSTKGNDLDLNVHGKPEVSLEELRRVTDTMLHSRAVIFPSPEDVHFMSWHKVREHRVFTAFIVQDGQVMKPPAGWKGQARLEFVILEAREVGRMPDGSPVHRATIVGTFEGHEVLRTEVHVTPATKADPLGNMFMAAPDHMVPVGERVGGGHGGAQAGGDAGTSTPGRTGMTHDSEAKLKALEADLDAGGKAELAAISAGKKPEEVWALLESKRSDPKRYLEGRARTKAGAGAKAAAKEARITETHQRLVDTGFFESPLIQEIIAKGNADTLRGQIAEHLTKLNAKKEFAGRADFVVHDDVEVVRRYGEYKTRAEAQAKDPASADLWLYDYDGKVWQRITNFDVLVVHKREVVRMAETKSGSNDRLARAKAQQGKGIAAMAELAAGNPNIRLHRHRHIDLTDTIDAATATADKAKVVGPDDKGFEMKLGVTTTDLGRLAREILERAKPQGGK
jgi:hypothetical protein